MHAIQAPQKAITSIASSSGTFLAGTADGRVLSYHNSTGESTIVEGVGHTNLVSGLATSHADGKIYSAGFDDRVREIESDGKVYT